jgi:hypothetical protein
MLLRQPGGQDGAPRGAHHLRLPPQVEPPDCPPSASPRTRTPCKWLNGEYHWYHFGISQEVADLVYNDIVRLLSGTHEGQKNGCPLTSRAPIAAWDLKEYGDYRWIRFESAVGGAQVHFRTTGEKALGSLGKDMHGISFDEAGIERNLPFLVREVFNLRRLGTGGQLLMVSTPSEELGSDFADMWSLGDPEYRSASTRGAPCGCPRATTWATASAAGDVRPARRRHGPARHRAEHRGQVPAGGGAYFNGANVDDCFIVGMPERARVSAAASTCRGSTPRRPRTARGRIVLKVVENSDDPYKPFLVGVYAEQKRGAKSTPDLVSLAYDGYARSPFPASGPPPVTLLSMPPGSVARCSARQSRRRSRSSRTSSSAGPSRRSGCSSATSDVD